MENEMKKKIKKQLKLRTVLYCVHDKDKVCGACLKRVSGNVLGIYGDISGICGDASGISGNVSEISGDVSEIYGDVSGICGHVTGISGNVSQILEVSKASKKKED